MSRGVGVLLVLVAACYQPGSRKTPPIITRQPDAATAACVTAWAAFKSTSIQAVHTPAEGGYRVLDPQSREKLKAEIDAAVAKRGDDLVGEIRAETFNALGAAVHDALPALRMCMQQETNDPDTQYILHFDVIGVRHVAAMVDHLQVHRVAETHADGSLAVIPTTAEVCFRESLERIELPDGGGPATMEVVIRAQDCLPGGMR